MAHGTPDWGLVGPKRTTYGLDDVGEAAVRLGSPHLFDRRGDCLHLTDFGDGIGIWQFGSSGAGSGTSLVTEHGRQGAYSVGLTAGSTLNREAHMWVLLPYPVHSLCGLEFSFALDGSTAYFESRFMWYTGGEWCRARVRFDMANQRLEYYNALGGYTIFADPVRARAAMYCEDTMKIVMDLARHEYIRCIFNNVRFDMRGMMARAVGSVLSPSLNVDIWHYSVAANVSEGYVDNVIITQNEPVYQG